MLLSFKNDFNILFHIFFSQISVSDDDGNVHRCEQCKYPMCNQCHKQDGLPIRHSSEECDILMAINQPRMNDLVLTQGKQLPNYIYEPILPLRMLLTKW
jgi:hypothetical protein